MTRDVYIMVGISGAGKSTWVKNATSTLDKSTYRVICPDFERKKLTGDISNQDKNDKVFSNCNWKLAKSVDNELVSKIYWDATNLNTQSLKSIKKIIRKSKYTWSIHVVCFEDSRNWELCTSRVEKDLANGVDRSVTVGIINEETGLSLIQLMSQKYVNLVDKVLDDWCTRNNVEKIVVGETV